MKAKRRQKAEGGTEQKVAPSRRSFLIPETFSDFRRQEGMPKAENLPGVETPGRLVSKEERPRFRARSSAHGPASGNDGRKPSLPGSDQQPSARLKAAPSERRREKPSMPTRRPPASQVAGSGMAAVTRSNSVPAALNWKV